MDSKLLLGSRVVSEAEWKDSSKPHIDKVNDYEIYLVDDHNRHTRRICGFQRKRMSLGYVCTKSAGEGTGHLGVGPCKSHDHAIANSNNTGLWERLNRANKLPANLLEFLQNAEEIEERHLVDVDEDIRILYAMQAYVLSRRRMKKEGDLEEGGEPEGFLFNEDIDLIMKLTDRIVKAKGLRLKLKKEISIDDSTIKIFMDQVFRVILASAAKGVSKRIIQQILEEVIMPFKTQGRIVGHEFEYETSADAVAKEVMSKGDQQKARRKRQREEKREKREKKKRRGEEE